MTELARLRLIETAARDLLPTLESYSDDIDLIDFRAALTPVADTAGIDAAWADLYADINNGQRGRADVIRLIEEHRPAIHAATLDGAWDEARDALPDGWCDLAVYHFDTNPEGHQEPSCSGSPSGLGVRRAAARARRAAARVDLALGSRADQEAGR